MDEVEETPVSVLVVDDQAPFRRAASTVVALTKGFEMVGEARSGEEAETMVENLSDFIRAFQQPIGAGDPHFIEQTARHYRPIAVLSDALDYKLYGLDFPMGWQVTNLLVHLGVTLLVYALARAVGLVRWAAFFAAALFTLHPAIVGTVPAIARRHDTLSALFFLASLVLLMRGQRVLPAVLFAVSILSKETSLAALPFVPFLLIAAGIRWTRAWVLLPPAIIPLVETKVRQRGGTARPHSRRSMPCRSTWISSGAILSTCCTRCQCDRDRWRWSPRWPCLRSSLVPPRSFGARNAI